jgi:hypothetical protein
VKIPLGLLQRMLIAVRILSKVCKKNELVLHVFAQIDLQVVPKTNQIPIWKTVEGTCSMK